MTDQTENLARPLIAESSTSESTTVEVAMGDLRDGTLTIPDYQRDTDQWDQSTKSLLIESVINNLTIPAFFFEVSYADGVATNSVVDGQQRLTTLQEFYSNKLRLAKSDDASYLSPQSVHYAGKVFDDLPAAYKQAFKKYRLTVIKLRDLGTLRLETFRRINRGGEPLSGQDIRLAYYGDESPSVQFVRIAGIYDVDRPGAKRFLDSARAKFGFELPWDDSALVTWKDWWDGRELARGQTASETFLWAFISAHYEQLGQLLSNEAALANLRFSYDRSVDGALDAFCAQLQYQDRNPSETPLLGSVDELRERFFPFFASWLHTLLSKGSSISVSKHRVVAGVIGAAYALGIASLEIDENRWGDLVEFVRAPRVRAQFLGIAFPASKGRWDGQRGYGAQLAAIREVLQKILQ
jgi:Protein of unknown function DUF262